MKNLKLNAVKALFAIAIFCPAIFADGEMGSGGFASSDVPPVPVKSERTLEDGEMGSGGFASSYFEYVILAINDYIDSAM